MAYSIYAHQSPSGKVYIGQTKQNPTRRWGAGHGYRCCGAFKNAIDKYGWDNISHSILFENLEEDEANKLEKLLISIFRSVDRNYGYNILEGGGNGDMPQEVKDKISKANKYESISSASNDTGIGRTSINNALSGYSRSAGGYTWKYAERGRFY